MICDRAARGDMARKRIMSMVLYEGDIGPGPLDLENKLSEGTELMNTISTQIHLDNAEKISELKFRQGHPRTWQNLKMLLLLMTRSWCGSITLCANRYIQTDAEQ